MHPIIFNHRNFQNSESAMRILFNSAFNLLTRFRQALLLGGFIFATGIFQLSAQNLDVPYVPTPNEVVERMLDLTNVNSSDYVIDLGSGDGRIVIAAAKRGATGHGIDLDPQRISEARTNAVENGVDDQIMFMEGDLFETDFSEASVVTMYLLPSVNRELRPVLLEELQPGTRIVSHSFDMGDWEADEKVTVEVSESGRTHTIYYWVIPAQVDGTWSWSAGNQTFNMDITQNYQKISVTLTDNNGTSYSIEKADVTGERIAVRAQNGDQNYIISGRVEGDTIFGTMQHHDGDDKQFFPWEASRN